jgi:hypothetical protein
VPAPGLWLVDVTPGELAVQAVNCQIFSAAQVKGKITSQRLVRKNEEIKMAL